MGDEPTGSAPFETMLAECFPRFSNTLLILCSVGALCWLQQRHTIVNSYIGRWETQEDPSSIDDCEPYPQQWYTTRTTYHLRCTNDATALATRKDGPLRTVATSAHRPNSKFVISPNYTKERQDEIAAGIIDTRSSCACFSIVNSPSQVVVMSDRQDTRRRVLRSSSHNAPPYGCLSKSGSLTEGRVRNWWDALGCAGCAVTCESRAHAMTPVTSHSRVSRLKQSTDLPALLWQVIITDQANVAAPTPLCVKAEARPFLCGNNSAACPVRILYYAGSCYFCIA
ncbi:hypothetical protein NPX13_g7898 [Xylaria arbuscula]|uniref:Uncharacterized protein n=1 Tax=Xylaria arbuscula TaxID=114810 RepID=A0A9W8N9N7_9PEZI|nr:hypothetical protein NPX13_g7898 [Xylaria arbuscula]